MRVKRITTWLVLGIAVALAYEARRRRGAPPRRAVPARAGARGQAAALDESALWRGDEAGDLFVEAIAGWDVRPASELEVGMAEPAAPDEPRADALGADDADFLGEAARVDVYDDRRAPLGAGDLYGVHVVPAVERRPPDDDLAQDEGENWLERLEASSGELGPEPEHELDVVDESTPHAGHHKTDTSDTPVADHGSGGPRGL